MVGAYDQQYNVREKPTAIILLYAYYINRHVCMVVTNYSKSMDQPDKVANPARGQLNSRENEYFPVPVRA